MDEKAKLMQLREELSYKKSERIDNENIELKEDDRSKTLKQRIPIATSD